MKIPNYNPDVLNCLANLSNDEVFTPPELANKMLDLLPQHLFQSPDTTFLDPFTKTGVFLREIVKRLDRGLETVIPDRQKRIHHILHHQVFGIACTELTALLARRSVYCSKDANGPYSISKFATSQGNILYQNIPHTWVNGKCRYCGASQAVYDRGPEAEQYAYMFIHSDNPKHFFNNMNFDVIIGNPPYQLSDSGFGISAKPIYDKFILQAKCMNPRYISIIVPARWFAGGKGLDEFRDGMLHDARLRVIHDYPQAYECIVNPLPELASAEVQIPQVVESASVINPLHEPIPAHLPEPSSAPTDCPWQNLKVGDFVIHKSFGQGHIVSLDEKYLIVEFSDRESRFLYPDAFTKGYLSCI